MIFQIEYNDSFCGPTYQKFRDANAGIIETLDYKLYKDKDIYEFLEEHGLVHKFENLNVSPETREVHGYAIECDFLRLAILYHLGGIYFDLDIYFQDGIHTIQEDLEKMFGDRLLLPHNKSFNFLRSGPKNPATKFLLNKWSTDKIIYNDVEMLRSFNPIRQFPKDAMLVSYKYLHKYYKHISARQL